MEHRIARHRLEAHLTQPQPHTRRVALRAALRLASGSVMVATLVPGASDALAEGPVASQTPVGVISFDASLTTAHGAPATEDAGAGTTGAVEVTEPAGAPVSDLHPGGAASGPDQSQMITQADTPAARPLRPGTPLRLTAPDAGLDAPVEPVWLEPINIGEDAPGSDHLATATMQLGLPSSPTTVGWYALGPVPGQPGATLLVGHLDTVAGPAVFAGVPALRPGAELALDLAGGTNRHFVVDRVWRHPAQQPAPNELFALSGPSRVYLVTCTGRFVRAGGGYQERLIVAATPYPDGQA